MSTNIIFALWMLAVGIIAISKPGFFFRADKLTPEKIKRNIRIWRGCGVGLAGLGVTAVVVELLRR